MDSDSKTERVKKIYLTYSLISIINFFITHLNGTEDPLFYVNKICGKVLC